MNRKQWFVVHETMFNQWSINSLEHVKWWTWPQVISRSTSALDGIQEIATGERANRFSKKG
jgi:hypothetical protein